jgi:hypothetical protein
MAKAPDTAAPEKKTKDEQQPAAQPALPAVAGSDPAAEDALWEPEVRDATKAAEPVAAAVTAMATNAPITGPVAVNDTDSAAPKKDKKKKNKKSKARKVDAGAAGAPVVPTPAASANPKAQV